jgi:hypothetical protein
MFIYRKSGLKAAKKYIYRQIQTRILVYCYPYEVQ